MLANAGCLYSQWIQTPAPSLLTNNDDYFGSTGFIMCLKGSEKQHHLQLPFNSMFGS